MNEFESDDDDEYDRERKERYERYEKNLNYLHSAFSIDEPTARFAASRFPHEWIRQAVAQAKSGHRPSGLFLWLIKNPSEVKVKKKPAPPRTTPGQAGEKPPTGIPATDAEISTAVDSICEKLDDGENEKGLHDGNKLVAREEKRSKEVGGQRRHQTRR